MTLRAATISRRNHELQQAALDHVQEALSKITPHPVFPPQPSAASEPSLLVPGQLPALVQFDTEVFAYRVSAVLTSEDSDLEHRARHQLYAQAFEHALNKMPPMPSPDDGVTASGVSYALRVGMVSIAALGLLLLITYFFS
jgi:hypothetical protein